MPTITINGKTCSFDAAKPGQPPKMILQVANDNGVEIPQYCYHDGLSIVASCRICLVEIHAPDPKTGKITPFMGGKLMPSCQTPAADGMIVYADSPKAAQNQKAVMEYLLINHPLDCPVCDQAGECFLQDYSYQYGRGVSRFEEQKVKQPKKDLGPTILLYSDRCIMCSRCVRFTREVSGTNELMVLGRGNRSEIDVFPGKPLDNPLAGNVTDLCPVGALEDKDFLFQQRVWFLKETPSIDPLTASGDNISIHHNEGKIYRVRPRTNAAVNKWWITDEVRYGWKFVHSEDRLTTPMRRQHGLLVESDWTRAEENAIEGLRAGAKNGRHLAVVVSPMLPCEEAFALAEMARAIDPGAHLYVGHVPMAGEDRVFPPNLKRDDPKAFVQYAEKAPNARGVKRVLDAVSGLSIGGHEEFVKGLLHGSFGAVLMTRNYPGFWLDDRIARETDRGQRSMSEGGMRPFLVLVDTLSSPLVDQVDVVLPSATFAEKSGSYENARGMIQAFAQAIPVLENARTEGQIAMDLIALTREMAGLPAGTPARAAIDPHAGRFDTSKVRAEMAKRSPSLAPFANLSIPESQAKRQPDMAVVEL
jgi:NADH-quinone oxidoreductase subunit G